jgi:hypothetical protein
VTDVGGIDEARLRDFLKTRSQLQPFFPGIFLAIRTTVETQLADFDARGTVGEIDRETVLKRDPQGGLATPYDWVAFGFSGYEFYDAHVGIVMDTTSWPCTMHVGFHRRAHLPDTLHDRVDNVDWNAAVGLAPTHVVIEATGEHQLRDAARPFDFSQIDSEVAHFARRAAVYYRTASVVLSQESD